LKGKRTVKVSRRSVASKLGISGKVFDYISLRFEADMGLGSVDAIWCAVVLPAAVKAGGEEASRHQLGREANGASDEGKEELHDERAMWKDRRKEDQECLRLYAFELTLY